MDYKAMGKRIRKKRKAMRFAQEKLAEHACISFAFVGHIERGTRVPSVNTVYKIARALNCSIDELVGLQPKLPESLELNEKAIELLKTAVRIADT